QTMTRTTTTVLALAASAAALGVSAPAPAMAAGNPAQTAASLAKGIVPLCKTGFTRKTVTTDRFTLAGCIQDVTDATGAVTAYQALGAVTLNGAALSPETAGSLLTLQRKRTVGKATIPAKLTSTTVYDVSIEGVNVGSFTPNVVTVAGAAAGVS